MGVDKKTNPQAGYSIADAFALLGITLVAGVLVIVSFKSLGGRELKGWEKVLSDSMLLYLMFVFIRTGAFVVLSFADWYFHRKKSPPQSYPLVSVIVPCFNEEKVVEQAVASIMRLDYPNYEILVVDDGSTDMTLTAAKRMETERSVRVIYQKNAGKAEALNAGIAEALGEFVLCVDADSVLDPGVITYGIPYFENNPKLAAVAGSVQIGNANAILTKFQRLEYIVGLNFHKTAQSFVKAVCIVPGPVGLFRRQAVLDIGGYRSSTFAEDCDLTIRLLMAGYQTVYCAKMVAVTEAPEDYESLLKQRYRWSRGTLQAIKENSQWLCKPWQSTRNFVIIFYMLIETLLIPSINFLFAAVFVAHAIVTQGADILGPYFVKLTLLDVILTAYSVMFEKKLVGLVLLATVNRVTYGLSMEVLRFFSLMDELLGLPMNWNKLQRKGF